VIIYQESIKIGSASIGNSPKFDLVYDFFGVVPFLMHLPTLRSININPDRPENKDFDHRLPEHGEGSRGPVIWGMIFIMGDSVGFITPL
jgi:hypothetical protein